MKSRDQTDHDHSDGVHLVYPEAQLYTAKKRGTSCYWWEISIGEQSQEEELQIKLSVLNFLLLTKVEQFIKTHAQIIEMYWHLSVTHPWKAQTFPRI